MASTFFKRAAAAAVICMGCLVLLWTAAGIYLNSGHARRTLTHAVNGAIRAHFTVTGHRIRLAAGRLELAGVTLRGPSGEKLAGWERLQVSVAWASLLRGALDLDQVLLEGPFVHVQVNRAGRVNLAEAFAPDPEDAPEKPSASRGAILPLNLHVRRLSISDGIFRFANPAKGTAVSVPRIDLTASADTAQRAGKLLASLDGVRVEVSGKTLLLEGVHLDLAYASGRLDIRKAQLQGPAAHAKLTGHVDVLTSIPTVHLDLDATGHLTELLRTLGMGTGWTGDLGLRLAAQGPWRNPDLFMDLAYPEGNMGGLPVADARAHIILKDGRVRVLDATAAVAGGRIHGQGELDLRKALPGGLGSGPVDLDALDYRFEVTGTDVDLAAFPTGMPALAGRVSASVALEGSGIQPGSRTARADVRVSGTGITPAAGVGPVNLSAASTLLWDRGTADMRTLSVRVGDLALSAAGTYDTLNPRAAVRFELSAADLTQCLSPLGITGVAGSFELKGSVHGPLKQLAGQGRLNASALAVDGVRIGDLQATAQWDDGRLTLDPLTLVNDGSDIRLAGWVRLLAPGGRTLMKDPVIDLRLEARPLRLASFLDRLGGALDVTAEANGIWNRPKGRVMVDGKTVNLGVQTLTDVHLDARLEEGKLLVDELAVGLGDGQSVSGTGWISTDRRFALALNSTDVNLDRIQALAGQQVVSGSAALNLTAEGTLDNPVADGGLTLKNIHIGPRPLGDMAVQLRLEDHLISADSRLNFHGSGTYHLKSGVFSAQAVFDETDLSPYFQMAGKEKFGGRLSGRVTATGNANRPRETAADVDLDRVRLTWGTVELVRSGRVKALWNAEGLTLADVRLDLLTQGSLQVTGKTETSGPLNIRADGRLPFAMVEPFVGRITQPVGTVALTADIRGTSDRPDIQGMVTFADLGFEVPQVSLKVHDMGGRIRFTPEAVTLEDVNGQVGDGRFRVTGQAQLSGFVPDRVDAAVQVDRLALTVDGAWSALLDANLALTQNPSGAALKGDVVLLEGEYTQDVHFNLMEAASPRRRQSQAPAQAQAQAQATRSGALTDLGLDVTLRHETLFLVDNNVAQLEIAPDFTISGTVGRPAVTGAARVENGTLTYRNKVFEVTRGNVTFVDPYRIQPEVDVTGQVQVRDWTIFIGVKGPVEAPMLTLRSEPEAGDGDILSLLLFGRTTRELIDGEGGSSSSPEVLLAGMLANAMKKDIQESTGLDILTFETVSGQGGDDNGSDAVRVTMGKELSDRMTLKYVTESRMGRHNQWAIAEYKLLENILVNGFQGSRGSFGGELRFRIEFR